MLRNIKKLLAYRNNLKEDGSTSYQVSFVTEEHYLKVAQKLHAKVYLERNFITPDQLDNDGRMKHEHDPYQAHADYFIVTHIKDHETEVVATARQIRAIPARGHLSFPTMEKLDLYPNMRLAVEKLDPHDCVEISGLAKQRGHSGYAALLLYRAMWQYSLKSHHQLWLMACDASVYKQLSVLFGDALIEMGETTYYMGSLVVPAALEVDQSLNQILSSTKGINLINRSVKKELVKFFLRGLPTEFLTPQHIKNLNRLSLLKDSKKK